MIFNQADNIYLGGIAQDRVYLGDTLIWPSVVPPTPTGGTKLYYTSTDGRIVTPYNTTGWTANIISNTYVDGQGCIEFDGEVTAIPNYAFLRCGTLESVYITSGVTSIGGSAFSYCGDLTGITIPDSVTSIEEGAFSDCASLTGITIPSGVTIISSTTFSNCRAITNITIPEGVTSIGLQSFITCTSLTGITIPDSVTSIGRYAFDYCTSLTGITMQSTTPPTLGRFVFDNTNNCPIYVPAGSVNTYKQAEEWSEYANRIFPIA